MTDSLFGGWIQESDHTQSRRITELNEDLSHMRSSLSAANRTASALRSDLASLRGSIEVRLARLTSAFDAFVELSSLRDQLSLVAGPALVRQATRARLVTLGSAARGGPVLHVSGTPQAPGYWLADALAALGTDDEAAAAAGRAAVIDHRRTATFLTLAGAVCGRPDLAARWAQDVLGGLDTARPVTRAQRAVWLAAAGGRLGPDVRAAAVERLRAVTAALPAQEATATVTGWADQIRQGAPAAGPVSRTAATDAPQVPLVRRSVGALRALRTLVTGEDAVPPAGDTTLEEIAAVLRALVDEGAEEERELMSRVAHLEAVVTGSQAPGPAWDAPAGDLLTLLREDALERQDEVGVTAREACAAWLARIADTFLTGAEVRAPSQLTTSAMGVTVRVDRTGSVEGAERALANARTPAERHVMLEGWVQVALGCAAAVLWVAAGVEATDLAWFYGMLAVALTIGAGATVAGRAKHARDEERRVTNGVRFVEREVERLQRRLVEVTAVLDDCRQQARTLHTDVVTALGVRDPATALPFPGTSGSAPAVAAPDGGDAVTDAATDDAVTDGAATDGTATDGTTTDEATTDEAATTGPGPAEPPLAATPPTTTPPTATPRAVLDVPTTAVRLRR